MASTLKHDRDGGARSDASTPSTPSPTVHDVLAVLEGRLPSGLAALRKRVRYYQAWFPRGGHEWLHYELLADDVDADRPPTVEIHIEHGRFVDRVRPLLKRWATSLADSFPQARLEFDSKWARNMGRLRLFYPDHVDAATRANDLIRLIELTHESLWPGARLDR